MGLSNKMNERVEKLRHAVRLVGAQAILVSKPSNIYYLSNFSGHDSLLLISALSAVLITDFRYAQQAEAECKGLEVISDNRGLYVKASCLINKLKVRKVAVESGHMTIRGLDILKKLIKARIIPVHGIAEKQREIKDADEISKIKKSAGIAKGAMGLIKKFIKPNKSEKYIAGKIEVLALALGADTRAFDTICLTGENASMPHGRPGLSRITAENPVLVDFGVKLSNYSSDLTRMFFPGKMSKHVNTIYNIVDTARKKAIARIKPGIRISEIDTAARGYISSKGFGKYFGHATGHGVGIDVHEFPSINAKNFNKIRQGMVFTVEPGIYIPGVTGARVEDMVVVTENSAEVITR